MAVVCFQRPPYAGGQAPTPGTPPKKGENEDEVWRQRRQEKNQEMSTAIERARQRRDEEERRLESERRRGAEEKLKALEERSKKKNESKVSRGIDRKHRIERKFQNL